MKNSLKVKKRDVVTFEENDKVLIIDKTVFNNHTYVFVNEVPGDESTLTDRYKIMIIHPEDGTFETIHEKKTIQKIAPLFKERLKRTFSYNKEFKSVALKALDVIKQDSPNYLKGATSGSFAVNYFIDLIERLVKWGKHEHQEPLDLLSIRVMKDYAKSTQYYTSILVIGYVADSDNDINHFWSIPTHHPSDQAFIDEMAEWFEFGHPFEGSSAYAFYQSCGPFILFVNEAELLNYLKSECRKRFPNSTIQF